MLNKYSHKQRRHKRIRAKLQGSLAIPRVCVFKSNQHISAQIIDDVSGKTIISAHDLKIKTKNNKTERAVMVAQQLSELAKEKGISKVVFDRAGYKYHGRVKRFADTLRAGGLIF